MNNLRKKLVETFHWHQPPPMTDWDEQLMVPDGADGWAVSPDDDDLWWGDGVNSGNPPQSNQPGNWDIDHPTDLARIIFNPPVQPSTMVTITKDILVPQGMQRFAVFEWPTIPEPSLVLLALGLLGLKLRRK